MFRNENDTVKRKAKAKTTGAVSHSISRASHSSHSAIQTTPQLENTLYSTIDIHPNDKAMGFFFTTHADCGEGRYTIEDIRGSLLHSMQAVGFTGLMTAFNAPSLKVHATKEYLEAIRLTNNALSSPTEAKKDSTLLGILVLCAFEVLNSRDIRSLLDRDSHLKGAATILKMRGVNQLQTPNGRRLFLHILSQLWYSCVRVAVPLPEHVWQLFAEAEHYADQSSPSWRLWRAYLTFVDFNAKVHHDEFSDPFEIVAEASRQDDVLASIFSDVPSDWKYSVVQTNADPELVYSGRYHLYPSFLVVQYWNNMRCTRILLTFIQLEALSRDSKANQPIISREYHDVLVEGLHKTLRELQSDLLSSVPQHIGYNTKTKSDRFSQQLCLSYSDISKDLFRACPPDGELPDLRVYGGYALLSHLWPLGVSAYVTPDIRHWVIGVFRKIGSSMNVQLATVLSEAFQKKLQEEEVPYLCTCSLQAKKRDRPYRR